VHYLGKFLTYRDQICTTGTSDMDALTDRFTPLRFNLFSDVVGVSM